MAARHALERETFGQPLADRQGIQWMLADCARDLYIARLMVLHIAYKMEHGLDISQENSIAKNFIADMLSSVVDTALQIHGALGYTLDTPLAAWYAEVRMQHLVDGLDEVHRWRIGRNVLAAQRKSGTTAAAAGGDLGPPGRRGDSVVGVLGGQGRHGFDGFHPLGQSQFLEKRYAFDLVAGGAEGVGYILPRAAAPIPAR